MQSVSQSDAPPGLLPLPRQWRGGQGSGARFGATTTTWSGVRDPRVEQRLDELLRDAACGDLDIDIGQRAGDFPALDDDESYQLRVAAEGVSLAAATTWGALHGVTTLWQLHCAGRLQGASWEIEDRPRFSWRGVLIDVARHFMSVALLRRVVDGMTRLKMNVLHLHLSDDQGFRFTSAAFPRLASDEAYSTAELAALVAYAAARGVRVVPELDVPGHVTSWLVNYPQWGLRQVAATSRFGVHKACLDPADESVYAALETLFAEVGAVFADEYVHIGGDEVHPAWWTEDAQTQAFIASRRLDGVAGLQAYFNDRLRTALMRQGKRVIGWDEVLHAGVSDFVVQNWRGATTRDTALARSCDCIVSAAYYLDLCYPADLHYRFDPEAPQAQLLALEEEMKQDPRLAHVAAGLRWTDQWRDGAIDIDAGDVSSARGRVLGGEACLWAELVDEQTLETRLWSRLPAVAERLWSAAATTDVGDFYRRLQGVLNLPGFDLDARQRGQLLALGLDAAQIEVAALLEPVKWYARLLGEQALQARLAGAEMPQSRPYDIHSDLGRIVDVITPESLRARSLGQASSTELARQCAAWSAQEPARWPEDAAGAIGALGDAGDTMLELLDGGLPARARADAARAGLRALYVPHGEYMLAVVPPLLTWIDRWLAGDR